MTQFRDHGLTDLTGLEVHAQAAETVTWQSRRCLRLDGGLVLIPDLQIGNGTVEVSVGAEGAAFPGVAFRVLDPSDHELAYSPTHSSGRWDAIQYDPIFNQSNTWQIYHGPSYQRATTVPTGSWFRLRVSFVGDRAAIVVDDQPPLVVEQLAHGFRPGRLGVWTYLPAYFCDLSVSECDSLAVEPGVVPALPQGAVTEWVLDGCGVVRCEPNGVVNLCRYLSPSEGEARLTRRFELPGEARLALDLGFSDALTLELDGEEIFSGENKWLDTDDPTEQGYIDIRAHSVKRLVNPGEHALTAIVAVSEPFGWGLALAARAKGLRWIAPSPQPEST